MTPRLTYAQRKERIAEKIAKFQAGGDAGKYRDPALLPHLSSCQDTKRIFSQRRKTTTSRPGTFLVLISLCFPCGLYARMAGEHREYAYVMRGNQK